MKEIDKLIDIKNGKIRYEIHNGLIPMRSITYFVLNETNQKLIKSVSFSIWDDFEFSAFENKEELEEGINVRSIHFSIEKDNPIYEPLAKFLNNKPFLLDDDGTLEKNKKTMQISEDGNRVMIEFKNDIAKNSDNKKHITVFVKNIMDDGRSKLGIGDNTKERLIELFEEFDITLIPRDIIEDLIMSNHDNLNLYKETIFKIIPELKAEDGFEQKNFWHIYDVWQHTLTAIGNSKSDLQIRLALLLHDVGKPHSYQEEGMIRHFKGHAQKSAEIAKGILTRLGYDKREIEEICFLIKEHSSIIDIENVNYKNIEITKKLLYIQYCDASAYNPEYIRKVTSKLDRIMEELKEKEKNLQEIDNENEVR